MLDFLEPTSNQKAKDMQTEIKLPRTVNNSIVGTNRIVRRGICQCGSRIPTKDEWCAKCYEKDFDHEGVDNSSVWGGVSSHPSRISVNLAL